MKICLLISVSYQRDVPEWTDFSYFISCSRTPTPYHTQHHMITWLHLMEKLSESICWITLWVNRCVTASAQYMMFLSKHCTPYFMKSVYVVLQVVARQDGSVTVNRLHFLFHCWQDAGSVQAETIRTPEQNTVILIIVDVCGFHLQWSIIYSPYYIHSCIWTMMCICYEPRMTNGYVQQFQFSTKSYPNTIGNQNICVDKCFDKDNFMNQTVFSTLLWNQYIEYHIYMLGTSLLVYQLIIQFTDRTHADVLSH